MASMVGILADAGVDIVKSTAKSGMNNVSKAAQFVKGAHSDAVLNTGRAIKNATKNSEGLVGKSLNNSATNTVKNMQVKNLRSKGLDKIGDWNAKGWSAVKDVDLKQYAKDLNVGTGKSKSDRINRINEAFQKEAGAAKNINKPVKPENVKDAVEDIVEEKVKSSRGKNALIGSAVGGISGAGIGGITGMATGADKDDQNGMIVTGALAGMTGGAIVGGLFGNNISKVAGGIAKGASNEAVEGGAKGFLSNVGASVQDFADKIDDVGERISNNISRGAKQEQVNLIKDIKRANPKMTTSQILNDLRNSEGILNGVYSENAENITKMVHRGNTIGGAAQGAIMGSVSGAVVGGVAGGIDEDDTFLGGALKGGLIGGTLGGIGGGVSGYFNNNARLFTNTTANVNSLLGKK